MYSFPSAVTSTFNEVDRLLQLRFQSRGIAYLDGLFLRPVPLAPAWSPSPSVTASPVALDGSEVVEGGHGEGGEVDSLVGVRALMQRGLGAVEVSDALPYATAEGKRAASQVRTLDRELTRPQSTFEVGQVVRHKKFGYRAVIRGFDQRPLFDVKHWEGVVGLAEGAKQPFYMVIPDQYDVERIFGGFRDHYYVAQVCS
jgi:hemimethylated DNA binding protein